MKVGLILLAVIIAMAFAVYKISSPGPEQTTQIYMSSLDSGYNCKKLIDMRWKGEVIRCENTETICYIYAGYKAGSLSCKFKEGGGLND